MFVLNVGRHVGILAGRDNNCNEWKAKKSHAQRKYGGDELLELSRQLYADVTSGLGLDTLCLRFLIHRMQLNSSSRGSSIVK
jgi:hypothetical protein